MSNVVCGRKCNLLCASFQRRGWGIILFEWHSKAGKVLLLFTVSKRFRGTQVFDVVAGKKKTFALQIPADLLMWILVAVRYMELHDFGLKFIKTVSSQQLTCVLLTLILSAFSSFSLLLEVVSHRSTLMALLPSLF